MEGSPIKSKSDEQEVGQLQSMMSDLQIDNEPQ
jgi:hypothetical protein